MLSRSAVDVVRFAQMAVAMFAIAFPVFADAEDEAEVIVGLVGALIVLLTELKERGSVTPVADPRNDAGQRLTPTS